MTTRVRATKSHADEQGARRVQRAEGRQVSLACSVAREVCETLEHVGCIKEDKIAAMADPVFAVVV